MDCGVSSRTMYFVLTVGDFVRDFAGDFVGDFAGDFVGDIDVYLVGDFDDVVPILLLHANLTRLARLACTSLEIGCIILIGYPFSSRFDSGIFVIRDERLFFSELPCLVVFLPSR